MRCVLLRLTARLQNTSSQLGGELLIPCVLSRTPPQIAGFAHVESPYHILPLLRSLPAVSSTRHDDHDYHDIQQRRRSYFPLNSNVQMFYTTAMKIFYFIALQDPMLHTCTLLQQQQQSSQFSHRRHRYIYKIQHITHRHAPICCC